MQKISRLGLYCAGAIVAFLAVALLAVNLYVQSRGTQARIEEELSERLGTALEIRRISVTPWWGLKLTGITMPQTDESVPSSFLEAEALQLRIRIGSLFSRRLVIKEIALIKPDIVWAQNADGEWRLPSSFPTRTMMTASRAATSPVAPPEPAPAPPVEAAPPSPPAASVARARASPAPFTPEVRRVSLTNGNFRFLDEKKKLVAIFEGVRFRSNFRSATVLNGNASIRKTSLRDRFFLENLKSPLSYNPTELDFSAITARVAEGEMMGRFTMRPADADSPFTVMVKFRELDADRILSDAHGPEGMVRGKLEGHLDATGHIADPNALNGAGEIALREGEVRRYSLLVALGQMLQIEELMQLKLEQAHVKYHITPGVVTIDELLFTSPNLRLSANGTVSFTGKLELEAQLAINERIRRQLFKALRANFQPIDVPGYTAVAFQVSGTLERPKTNLMDKVVGDELRDLSGVIDRLFGRGRPPRSKRQKVRDEAPAAPTVAPPPAEEPPQAAPAEATPTPEPTASP